MKCIAMIPARFSASRFHAKLVQDLGGKPVIVRTYEAALKTNLFDEIYIVTDHETIRDLIESEGGKVIMSVQEYECGSDRIAAAAQSMEADIIVNVQGDEPFIDRDSLEALIEVFKNDRKKEIDLASLMHPLHLKEDIENPNNVKVVVDTSNFALYFSRAPIPFWRDKEVSVTYYKHKGVYAFRKEALLAFPTLPMSPLESAEKIEAIRYLEYGKKIKMVETPHEGIGIDTQEDLIKANKEWNAILAK